MFFFSWKRVLRLLAGVSLLIAIGWVYFDPGFEPVLTVLGAIAAFITSFFVDNTPKGTDSLPEEVNLYEVDCGDGGVDLANQRLRVSAAFGAYFTSLLERGNGYVPLSGQIDCPVRKGLEGLPPIQRIFWYLQNPKGPRVFILAADGGMGKSTLASKIVRCLYEQEAIDMILGDSAKSKHIDPTSGQLLTYTPGYETTWDGARRELQEETGLSARQWTYLGTAFTSNSFTNEVAYFYLAEKLTQGATNPDHTEELTVQRVPFEKAWQMVIQGEIKDAMSIIGLLRVKYLLDLRKK
jgi:hypothetical protein